jgi:hypothetical protein
MSTTLCVSVAVLFMCVAPTTSARNDECAPHERALELIEHDGRGMEQYAFRIAHSLEGSMGHVSARKEAHEHEHHDAGDARVANAVPFAEVAGVLSLHVLCGVSHGEFALSASISDVSVSCDESATPDAIATDNCASRWVPLKESLGHHAFWLNRNASGSVIGGVVFAAGDEAGSRQIKEALIQELSVPTLCGLGNGAVSGAGTSVRAFVAPMRSSVTEWTSRERGKTTCTASPPNAFTQRLLHPPHPPRPRRTRPQPFPS